APCRCPSPGRRASASFSKGMCPARSIPPRVAAFTPAAPTPLIAGARRSPNCAQRERGSSSPVTCTISRRRKILWLQLVRTEPRIAWLRRLVLHRLLCPFDHGHRRCKNLFGERLQFLARDRIDDHPDPLCLAPQP